MSVILGLNCYHAGAAACVLVDGVPVAALPEERINRIKYYAAFPSAAIRQCLDMAGLEFKDVEHVARLARLELSEEELELYTRQLGDILGYVEQLND